MRLVGWPVLSLQTSAIYKSAAWGKEDQPDFYNQAIKIQTKVSPRKTIINPVRD
jgi:7,8-dihydro-6-hydroxymethylpterin-pyrophosphokinase